MFLWHPSDHAVLVKDLNTISTKWEQFGVILGVPFNELTRIRNNVSGRDSLTEFCFNRVIDAWLSGKKEYLTKEFLVEAIRGVGGFSVLAAEVEKMSKCLLLGLQLFHCVIALLLVCKPDHWLTLQ